MLTYLIIAAAFVCVTCLVGGVAMLMGPSREASVEERLDFFTATGPQGGKKAETKFLSSPLEETSNVLELYLSQFVSFKAFLQQADTTLTPSKFAVMTFGLFLAPTVLAPLAGLPLMVGPAIGLIAALGPLLYLYFRRKSRLAKFGAQLPEALELVARALRAGHSLASGFRLVSEEMRPPIGIEFQKAYESQNFGVPLEQAIEEMTERVPNLDLRFFATAVILQRQTGGDLAEILDKIGHLVRERFKIWGQIQALTGEGRLSGIVLLAMPPALFLVMFRMNPEYCMVLFRDPMGQQMLGGAIVMQILGALVIRKIVNIRV
jgi:tight adherence protein B